MAFIGKWECHFTDFDTKFQQFDWPELMLPIKFHQFKMCQLTDTGNAQSS